MDAEAKRLTRKQKLFISEYLQVWNATEAARRAGYSEKTAYSIGSENLRKPEIAAAIQARLAEVHMSSDEALKLLADQARGDIGDVFSIGSMGFELDLQSAREQGKTKLIKRVRQRTTTFIAKKPSDDDREITETEIELYDAQAALDKILRVHGKFAPDKLDITSGGEKLNIVIKYDGNSDADDNGNAA